ncbi:LADA_0B05182g1_1 [Lachancea dasiensis]|uniref:LADA_0B05182g1_1 n=1 Tax=Lachancea dasiensis TaxID=1072105 RepID=A0A1G4ITB8_9SACH|nr:LADA_0B05182g1_1 [Lachancea dasiensis]
MGPLESAITGAVASTLADTIVYPLDVAKTLIQTQKKRDIETDDKDQHHEVYYKNTLDALLRVVNAKGVCGLYQGLMASTIAGFLQSFSYFFWYSIVRKTFFRFKLLRGKGVQFSTPEELLLGVMAAAISQLFTSPMGVISKRQQTAMSKNGKVGFKDVLKQIYDDQNSITGFWRGLKVSLILTINPSITYASYEKLTQLFISASSARGRTELKDTAAQLSPRQNFILGVASKMISTIITQPLILSKAWLQRTGSQFHSFQEVLIYLYTHEGVLSLWKGLAPQLSKGLLVQGLLLMFKGELIKLMQRLFFRLRLLRNAQPRVRIS